MRILLLLALVVLVVSGAMGQYSGDGRIMTRSSTGFVYNLVVFPDSMDFVDVDDRFTGSIPTDSSFAETLQVARDWDFDGTVDDVGASFDWMPLQAMSVSYYGTGPDTLWVRALDDTMGVIQTNIWYAPSSTTQQLTIFDPWLIRAERVAYTIGRQLKPAQLEHWKIETYHER